MNFFATSAWLVAGSTFLSGLFVIYKNPRGRKNLYFLAVCLSLTLWSVFYALWQMADNAESALLLVRISIACAALIPVTNVHMIMVVLDVETVQRKSILKIFYLISILIILSSPTKYFIPEVVPKMDFPFWPTPGPMMHLHFLNMFMPALWVLYLIWEKKVRASALMKNKIKWLFMAHVVSYVGGISNNFLWYDIPIKPYLTVLSSAGIIITASTFFRLGVIDIGYFIRKMFVHLVFLGSVVGVVMGLMGFTVGSLREILLIGSAVILAVLISPLAQMLITKWAQRFWKDMVGTKEKMEKSRRFLQETTFTYDDLARNIVTSTMETFSIEMAAVYFFDLTKHEYILRAQKGMENPMTENLRYNRSSLAIAESNMVIKEIDNRDVLINLETYLNDIESEGAKMVIDEMNRIEAEICLPFLFAGKTRGLLVVGKKKGNTLFNDDEFESIHAFARMGTEIMRFILGVETELNHTALYSHDMNHDVRSLMQTLEFLGSPMAAAQPAEKKQSLVDQALRVAQRLFDSFQMNRNRSSLIMKTIRGEYDKKPVDAADILKLSSEKFSLQAEKAGVSFTVNVEEGPAFLSGNDIDLTRVFDNLIANALRHLPEKNGRLEVVGRNVDNKTFDVRIKDNGDGIEPENLEKVFQLGWQSESGKKGSAGFGLSIVKQIVQIHNGAIQALSQGPGTGTEFRLTLPLEPLSPPSS